MGTNGTVLRGTPAYTTGKFGQGVSGGVLSFDGVDAGLSSSGGPSGTFQSFTIEGWFKGTEGGLKVLISHGGWYYLASNGGVATFTYNTSSGEQTISSGVTVNDGAYHHLVVDISAAGIPSLYVDGARAVTGTLVGITPPSGDAVFAVGGLSGAGAFDTGGQIDEVRLSNSRRYTGSTYTVPTSAFTSDANTISLWHFDGNANDSAAAVANIAPSNPNIVYSPYNWMVGATAKTINPGASFRQFIVGGPTSVSLGFDLTGIATPVPRIWVYVDGQEMFTGPVAATVNVPLPAASAAWSKHLVEVVVKSTTQTQDRWNTQASAVKYTGTTTTPSTCTLGPLYARPLRGLAYGDSLAEGSSTAPTGAAADVDNNDSTCAWAYPLGDLLGAEMGVVAFGGNGFIAGGNGNITPLPQSFDKLWSGQARSFTPAPDFIVMNQGTNDFNSNVTTAATTVLNGLLAATPSTTKIFVVQPWNGTGKAAELRAAIAACTAPSRVVYIDTTGWWNSADASDSLHPYGYSNLSNLAPRVAAAIRQNLGGGSGSGRLFTVRGGALVPLSI